MSPAPTPAIGHIVMVGLPGAGKSSVGRMVARALGRPFLDFDLEIERRSGKSVVTLFAEGGEAKFREREVALTRELVAAPPMVLAPGGGWVCNPQVVALLRPPGKLVHLKISPAGALRRLRRSHRVRPLIQTADPMATILQLWANRAHLYEAADFVVDVEVIESQQVVAQVVSLARDLTTGLG